MIGVVREHCKQIVIKLKYRNKMQSNVVPLFQYVEVPIMVFKDPKIGQTWIDKSINRF